MSSFLRLTGGIEQALSPEWTPASSMCSMMPPMTTMLAVADRIDIELGRVVEELVDQDRVLAGDLDGLLRRRPSRPLSS